MKKLGATACLVFSILLLVSLLNSLEAQAASVWNYDAVVPNEKWTSVRCSSLAVDSAGDPHVCYSGGELNYAVWTGSTWSKQFVDNGFYPSLVLDSADNPHISYQGWTYGYLMYASWNGSTWAIQVVDQNFYGDHSYLALDKNGNPHISYSYEYFNGTYGVYCQLKYASWDGTAWNIQDVDSPEPRNNGIYGGAFALDSTDNPHICYSREAGLTYYSWDGSSWNTQIIDSIGCCPTLAFDSTDNPHICYNYYYDVVTSDWNYTTDDLKYASWTGSDWNIITVENHIHYSIDISSSLALDSLGNAKISFITEASGLMYASQNGSNWDIQALDESSKELPPSLAVDSFGTPHISYIIGTGLYYTYFGEKPAATVTPQSSVTVEYTVAIVITATVVIASLAVTLLHRKRRNKKSSNLP